MPLLIHLTSKAGSTVFLQFARYTSAIQNMWKRAVESPFLRQLIVSSVKNLKQNMKHKITLPLNACTSKNDRDAFRRAWLTPHCASDFKGPDSTFARILSRK